MNPELTPEEEVIAEDIAIENLFKGTTQCNHYMIFESDDIAVCSLGCGHGSQIDKNTQDIRDGVIVSVL